MPSILSKSLTAGSIFSGIGGFDLGFRKSGIETVWQVENDSFCQGVLEKHWPNLARFSDVGQFVKTSQFVRPDILMGGFPCQDLSVAGRRAGLAGKRSGLFHEFMRLAAEFSPRWLLIENVPGLLSSAGGRDMAIVTSTLAGLGYGWAYRILDAQYFGLAQRRRRLFIVCCLGEPARAAKVLFESDCLPGNSAPGRTPGADTAGRVAACLNAGGNDGGFRTEPGEHLVAATWTRTSHQVDQDSPGENHVVIAYNWQSGGDARHNFSEGSSPALSVGQVPAVGVRRLTPVECERLQGFPDDWTRWRTQNGKIVKQSDSARYRQLGNAVAVPVAEWIARRIIEKGE